jgi:hypothetical protein
MAFEMTVSLLQLLFAAAASFGSNKENEFAAVHF